MTKTIPKNVEGSKESKTTRSIMETWLKKFIKDMKNPQLLPLKILIFLVYGANWALFPFLSLQARALGLTGEEVGIIYSFLIIPALICPPSMGLLADKVGNFRNMLTVVTIVSAFTSLAFMAVPVGRITHTLPNSIPAKISCSSSNFNLLIEDAHNCQHKHGTHFNMSYIHCYTECLSTRAHQRSEKNDNLICAEKGNCMFSYNDNIFPSIGNVTEEDIEIPQPGHFEALFQFESSAKDKFRYLGLSPFCPDSFPGIHNQSGGGDICTTLCSGSISRQEACTETKSIKEFKPQLTFYLHLFIRVFFGCTLATSMPLTEGALITVVKNYGGDFGFQRMYGNLGMMLMTPLSGLIVDQLSDGHDASSYNPAIYMYCVLKLLAAGIIFYVDLDFKPESNSVIADVWKLLKRYEVVSFILIALFAGQFYGFIETFLLWLLEDLGAGRIMMGLTVTVGSGCGILLLMFSSNIMKKLGYVNTIVFCFVCYVFRLLGYTMITNPWTAMPFEAMEAVTNSLVMVTFMAYSSHLASITTVVTLQGITQGLYHGVGRATGSMLGGYLIDILGTKKTFRVLAVASGVGGAIYFSTNLIYEAMKTSSTKGQEPEKGEPESSCQKTKATTENFRDNKAFETD